MFVIISEIGKLIQLKIAANLPTVRMKFALLIASAAAIHNNVFTNFKLPFDLKNMKLKLKPSQQGGKLVYTNCSSSNSIITNLHCSWNPNPPQVGKAVEAYASGTITSVIDYPTNMRAVARMDDQEMEMPFELCQALKDSNDGEEVCPISPSDFEIVRESDWEKDFPEGLELVIDGEHNGRQVLSVRIHQEKGFERAFQFEK